MKRKSRDGWIDVGGKAIVNSRGVTRVDHLYLAEKVGDIPIIGIRWAASAFHPTPVTDESGKIKIASADAEPRTKRRFGAAIMAIGLMVGVVSQADTIIDLSMQAGEMVDGILDVNPREIAPIPHN